MELKEQLKILMYISEEDKKPLIKWFTKFEKEIKKLKGSYKDIEPKDLLTLYYDGVSPKDAANQLKESTSGVGVWDKIQKHALTGRGTLKFSFPGDPSAKVSVTVGTASYMLGAYLSLSKSRQEQFAEMVNGGAAGFWAVEQWAKDMKVVHISVGESVELDEGEMKDTLISVYDAIEKLGHKSTVDNIVKETKLDKNFVQDAIKYWVDDKKITKMGSGKKTHWMIESVEHLDEYRRKDVMCIVDKKGKVVAAKLTDKNAEKEISRHRGGTIVLDPDAEVGDVLKTFAKESVELDEVRRQDIKFRKGDKVKWIGDEGESDQFGNNARQKPPLTDQELWDNVGTVISKTDTQLQRMFGVIEYKIKGRKVHIKNVNFNLDVVLAESFELDEVLSDREMERFTKAHTAQHKKMHKQALQIIKFIDSVAKHKDKWTDSFGDYVTTKMNPELALSNPNSVEYQQGRGRGDWSFLIGHGKVRYNNRNMPWMPKSGELPFNEFMKLLDIWKKKTLRESVELDEATKDKQGYVTFEFKSLVDSSKFEKELRILKRKFSKMFNTKLSGKEVTILYDKRFSTKDEEFSTKDVDMVRTLQQKHNGKLLDWSGKDPFDVDTRLLKKSASDLRKESIIINPLIKEGADAPTNNVGGEMIAGASPGEDPPVKKKRKKFAGCEVFEVDPSIYYNCVQGKKKFEHWKRYFDKESGVGAEIYEFAYKHPREAIIVQNNITQEMVYLRHKRK
jgi:hypothetical protein